MTDKTEQALIPGAYWLRWNTNRRWADGLNGWDLCWIEADYYGRKGDQAVFVPMSDNPYSLNELQADGLEYRKIEAPND